MSRIRQTIACAASAAGVGCVPFVALLAAAWVLYINGWITPAQFLTALTGLLVCCAAIVVGCALAALITALPIERR
ncbi:hypothetical protein [Nocardia pseudovaccinii]|uniref:hypothetical protein n=1 Tax=Nocardia pseudovaccinii TaxID=189540 RepID=UPI0007A42E87|nr:hypothetical protein [Nocardia pseudovaccinii]